MARVTVDAAGLSPSPASARRFVYRPGSNPGA
jgi:hypothetical protein